MEMFRQLVLTQRSFFCSSVVKQTLEEPLSADRHFANGITGLRLSSRIFNLGVLQND
jgi:hypothetical protein